MFLASCTHPSGLAQGAGGLAGAEATVEPVAAQGRQIKENCEVE